MLLLTRNIFKICFIFGRNQILMKITKKDGYVLFCTEKKMLFTSFFDEFNAQCDTFNKNNIILNLSNSIVNEEEIEQFNKISTKKANNGTSFVIVKEGINIDEISESLIVVPTFQEAIDTIEFDEMTRSLDF